MGVGGGGVRCVQEIGSWGSARPRTKKVLRLGFYTNRANVVIGELSQSSQ